MSLRYKDELLDSTVAYATDDLSATGYVPLENDVFTEAINKNYNGMQVQTGTFYKEFSHTSYTTWVGSTKVYYNCGARQTYSVTFEKEFKEKPTVIFSPYQDYNLAIFPMNVTTTGFTIGVKGAETYRTNKSISGFRGNIAINWIAFGKA